MTTFSREVWQHLLREAPRRTCLVRLTLAPTEGSCRQNRGKGLGAPNPARGMADKILRSRANHCVSDRSTRRSLRMTSVCAGFGNTRSGRQASARGLATPSQDDKRLRGVWQHLHRMTSVCAGFGNTRSGRQASARGSATPLREVPPTTCSHVGHGRTQTIAYRTVACGAPCCPFTLLKPCSQSASARDRAYRIPSGGFSRSAGGMRDAVFTAGSPGAGRPRPRARAGRRPSTGGWRRPTARGPAAPPTPPSLPRWRGSFRWRSFRCRR
jgi:hypothetical protein